MRDNQGDERRVGLDPAREQAVRGTNQDALQALFGNDVTACFGKRVLLEPAPMRVAGRERLTAVRVW